MCFLLILAVGLFGLTHAAAPSLIRLLISSDAIFDATKEFLNWRIFGFFFAFVNVMFRALYIGITRTKVLTLNAIVMAMVNVVLDYALIFGHFGLPALGLKGAAIASVIAEASSLVFFLLYTWARIDFRKYGLNHWPRFDFTLLGRILSISCFTMVQYFWQWRPGLFFCGCREIRTASTGHCKYSEKHLCGNADTCPVLVYHRQFVSK